MVIYKITNLINGKQYIGRDSHNDPNYYGSGPAIKNAIKKYGKQNFKKEIIEECSSFENLVEREEYWLNYYDAGNNELFYNIHNSGKGTGSGKNNPMFGKHHTIETREKISDGVKKKIVREKRIGNKNRLGTHHTEETKEKLRIKSLGRKITEETKKKMSQSHSGKKLSPDHKEKLRLSWIKRREEKIL